MGVVYLARHRGLRRLVALKMILSGGFASEAERQRFQREAELTARLKHPNIVRVYEAGVHESHPFLVMEWVGGTTLADRIGSDPWSPPDAARLVESLARAIDAAHRNGVVHRDLKPSNILLETDAGGDPSGPLSGAVPKIADFGLARAIEDGDALTSTGLAMGTPEYMAPEQASHGALAGPAADVYALGAMLYQLLTARLPFMADTPIEVLKALCSTEPVAPRRLRASLPRDLDTITLRAMEKEPARRYATAGALAEDLRRYLDGEPILARPPTALTRLVKWARRRPSLASLSFALALVTVAALIGLAILWAEAARSRDRAEAAALESANRGDAERRARYRADVVAAAAQIELNNLDAALDFLEDAPEEYRDWEWRHLAAQLDNPQSVFRPDDGGASMMALAPSGKLIAYSAIGGSDVRLRAPGASADRVVLQGLNGTVSSIAFSPDGSSVAAGSTAGTVRVWDLATGTPAWSHRLVPRRDQFVEYRVAYSPRGDRLVATGGQDRLALLLDARTGEPTAALAGHEAEVSDASFSPDGARIASADWGGTLRLWDMIRGEPTATIKAHAELINRIAFSPDGRMVATASRDRTVRLWDVATRRRLATLRHGTVVYGLAFKPGGTRLATACDDGTVRLWDLTTFGEVAALHGHGDYVHAVAFSPDGDRLATGSGDYTVRVWDSLDRRLGAQPAEAPAK